MKRFIKLTLVCVAVLFNEQNQLMANHTTHPPDYYTNLPFRIRTFTVQHANPRLYPLRGIPNNQDIVRDLVRSYYVFENMQFQIFCMTEGTLAPNTKLFYLPTWQGDQTEVYEGVQVINDHLIHYDAIATMDKSGFYRCIAWDPEDILRQKRRNLRLIVLPAMDEGLTPEPIITLTDSLPNHLASLEEEEAANLTRRLQDQLDFQYNTLQLASGIIDYLSNNENATYSPDDSLDNSANHENDDE